MLDLLGKFKLLLSRGALLYRDPEEEHKAEGGGEVVCEWVWLWGWRGEEGRWRRKI